jgi:hypothetical protein
MFTSTDFPFRENFINIIQKIRFVVMFIIFNFNKNDFYKICMYGYGLVPMKYACLIN